MSRNAKKADGHEVIIKRKGKKGRHDEHSGAWKVAFADFTLAMMALFMVLWIVQPQARSQSPSAGDLMLNPIIDGGVGVFDGTSRLPLDLEGRPASQAPRRETADKPEQAPARKAEATPVERTAERDHKEPGDAPQLFQTVEDLERLAQVIRDMASQVGALANIEVEVVPQGLRIVIHDDQQRAMFARGSARLEPHFLDLLTALAKVLVGVENRVIISGHTDAVPYRQPGYDNWHLSGDRALQARNALMAGGLPVQRLLQVSAQADVMPVRPEDPEDGANRRIEVLLLTEHAERLYRELFGDGYAQARMSADGVRFQGPATP
ncbi:OmpA family protein [Metapseudomonas otitidis]|uniref:OmpA family protein n=1 Tax=Metapseudomonas otitidis TaxID=319939 RepID=UPI0013F66034|nr:OmpA family protein [Pseudomonas otitidis]